MAQGCGSKSFALCLSGGGFRATFFHLGVVRLLADAGILKQVKYVFSVSGGSILAAHMAQHWNDYVLSDSSQFFQCASANNLLKFGERDVRGRVVRRWLGSFFLRGRSKLLEEEYQSLFPGATLACLAKWGGAGDSDAKPQAKPPRFYFLATSATSGRLVGFSEKGWFHVNENPNNNREQEQATTSRKDESNEYPVHFEDERYIKLQSDEKLPLAFAVAASSAFPPVFPPIALGDQYISDGGVFDNSGLSRIHFVIGKTKKDALEAIIVSDASAHFKDDSKDTYRSPLDLAIRTYDLLMQRVASLEQEVWKKSKEKGESDAKRLIQISIHPNDGRHAPHDCKLLASIRTDLDAFDLEIRNALIRRGYEVAQKTYKEREEETELEPSGKGIPKAHPSTELIVKNSKLRLGLWNTRERPLSVWCMLIAAIPLALWYGMKCLKFCHGFILTQGTRLFAADPRSGGNARSQVQNSREKKAARRRLW